MLSGPSWIDNFGGGVIQNLPPTKLPTMVSPRAWNTAMRAVQGGAMLVSRRPGQKLVAQTGGAAASVIVASAFFNYEEGGTISTHHIGVDSDGKIWELKSPTCTQLTIPTGTFGFAGSTLSGVANGIQFVQANNQLFGWVRGDVPFKIYRKPSDSTLYVGKVGLPAPAAPTYNSTLAGVMDGTIDVRCAYYNSASGVESNASATLTTAMASPGILRVNLPTTGPAECDKLRVYIRKRELQSTFTRDASMEVALGTATLDLNFTNTQLNQHILFGPNTTTNGQPPAKVICAWWHLSRMFVSDGKFLYYSQIGNGDQYDPELKENPGKGDGQRLTALRSLDDQVLAIFKERCIWGLIGSSAQTWQLAMLAHSRGTNSTLSVCEGDGLIGFWSENGPCTWDKRSEPTLLVHEVVKPFVDAGLLYVNRRDKVRSVFDPVGHRFLWAVDPVSATYPWTIIPWSTQYQTWESLGWDLGPVGALTLGPSASAELRIFVGGADRTMYEMAQQYATDGSNETTPGVRTVVSGTTAGLTLSSGSPSVNANGSVARLISLRTQQVHRSAYTLVGAALTWTTASTFTPEAGDLVLFDVPVAEYDTPDLQEGSPDATHRLLQTYVEGWTNADTYLLIGLYRNLESLPLRVWHSKITRNNRVTTGIGPALTGATVRHKRWAGFLALYHRFRIVFWYPLAEHGVVRIGWTTDIQGDED